MNEHLLKCIWLFQYFNKQLLVLNNGNKFQVIHPGRYNTNQWPDFLEAKIKIEDILWIGHVALHLKTSELIKNEYQSDQNYDNLLLYVVWENDQPDIHSRIPIFSLQQRVPLNVLQKAQNWMMESFISCGIQEQVVEGVENAQPIVQQENNYEEHEQGNVLNEGIERNPIIKTNDLDDEMKIVNCLRELKASLRKKPPLINGKIRSLKVITWQRETVRFYVKYGGHAKHVPKILLLGNWLTKAGFDCDTRVNVIPLTNMLIIIPEKQ